MKDSQIQALSKTSAITKTKVIVSVLILAGFGFIAYGSGFMPFIGKGPIGKIDTGISMKTTGALKASKDTSLIGGSGSIASKAEIIFVDGYDPSTNVYTGPITEDRKHGLFIDKVVGLVPEEEYVIEINGCFKRGGPTGDPIVFIANKMGVVGSSIYLEAHIPPILGHVDGDCWMGASSLAFYKRTSINIHKKDLVDFGEDGVDSLMGDVKVDLAHSVVARRTWVDIDIAAFEHADKFGVPLSTMDYFHNVDSVVENAVSLGMTLRGIDNPLDDLMSKAVSSGDGVKINFTVFDDPDVEEDCVDIEDAFNSLIDNEEAIAELESGVSTRVSEMTDEELVEFLGEGGYVVEDGMSSVDLAAEATMLGMSVVSAMTPYDFDVELCLKSGDIDARLNEILVVGPVNVDSKSGEEYIEARIDGGIPFGGLVDVNLPAVVKVSVVMFGVSVSVPIPIPESATECNGVILNTTANHNSDAELRVGVSESVISVSNVDPGEFGISGFNMDYSGTGICEVSEVQDWLGGIEHKLKLKIKSVLEDGDKNHILSSALTKTLSAYVLSNNRSIPLYPFELETAKFNTVLSGYRPRVEAHDPGSAAFFDLHGTDWHGFNAFVDMRFSSAKTDSMLKMFSSHFFGNYGGLPSNKFTTPNADGYDSGFSISTSLINQLMHVASSGYFTFVPKPTYSDLHICTQDGPSYKGVDACNWNEHDVCVCDGRVREKEGEVYLSRENLMKFIPEFSEIDPGVVIDIKMYQNLSPTVAMPVNMYDSGRTPAVFTAADNVIEFVEKGDDGTSKDRVWLRLGVDVTDLNYKPGFGFEDGRMLPRLNPLVRVMVLEHDFKTFPDDRNITKDLEFFVDKFVLSKLNHVLEQIPVPEFTRLSSYDGLACDVVDHEDVFRNPAHISMFSNLSCRR